MTDLPLHEAVIGVLRHWSDPRYVPQGLYLLNLGHPNQLFYFLGFLFSWVAGTTMAAKLVVALAIVGIPVTAARLADHLGTPRWTALLVAPLGMGWMFFWGLLANMIGLAVLLTTLPVFDRFCKKPTKKGMASSIGGVVLLYLAHESMMLCACLIIGLFTIAYARDVKGYLVRATPVVVGMGGGLLHLWLGQRLRPPFNASITTSYQPLSHKITIIPGALFAGYEPIIRTLMFALAMVPLLLFAVARYQQRPWPHGEPWREVLTRYRFEVSAFALLITYFAMPFTLSGATLFYHRFLPPAYAIFAVCLAPQPPASPRLLTKLAAGVVPLGSILLAWPTFVDSNKVTRDIDVLIDQVAPGQAYIVVDMGPTIPWRLFHPEPWEGHIVARRGGRCLFDFSQSPVSPAFLNPRYQWNEPYLRMVNRLTEFKPEHDLERFRYVFLHTTVEDWGNWAEEVLEPYARYIDHRGEWFLFESKRLKASPLSEDVAVPNPRPHSFHWFVRQYLRERDGTQFDPTVEGRQPGER
jgi:hypothetical protein